MINPIDFLPTVAWRTNMKNVLNVAVETQVTPALFTLNVVPVDVNDPGAPLATKDVGYYITDYSGNVFRIIEINIGGDSTKIKVSDDFREGIGPQMGFQGVLYKSADQGKSPFLAGVFSRHLTRNALEKLRSRELSILWRTRDKITFTSTKAPSITNYQANWASVYGEYPDVTIITDKGGGVEWERQEVPIRNFVGGKLDNIVYDFPFNESGYIILSR